MTRPERGIIAEITTLFAAKTSEMDAKMAEVLAHFKAIAAETRKESAQREAQMRKEAAELRAWVKTAEAEMRVNAEEGKKEAAQRERRQIVATVLIVGVAVAILGLFIKDNGASPTVVYYPPPAAYAPLAPSAHASPIQTPPQASGVVGQ